VSVAERCTRANFEHRNVLQTPAHSALFTTKCSVSKHLPIAAFEILKEKFQYVSDQLELNSKQHQAVKGRFVSYPREHVVVGFNSSCYDIHWRKRTC